MLQQLGRYRITRQLGAGGMGVVYLAEDSVLGRQVALKTVRLLEGTDPNSPHSLTERFLREARIVAQMDHPGIVSVFDFGYEGETAYLVLEYVAGTNLSSRLEQGPPMERVDAARVLHVAASALDYAHKRGVVHRDVKPANLLLSDDGRVKVADFGIAKLSGSTSMTTTGMLIGTVEYMSPEQIRGESVDGRSDQYSLAVVAYQLVTGKRPFQADSAITLAHMIVYEPVAPASAVTQGLTPVPLSVDQVLARALNKQPSARYASCAEFARDLTQAWEGAAAPFAQVITPRPSVEQAETVPLTAPAPRAVVPEPTPIPAAPPQSSPPPAPPAPAPGVKPWIWGLVAVMILAGAGTLFIMKRGFNLSGNDVPPSSQSAAVSQPPVAPPKSVSESKPEAPPVTPAQTAATPPAAAATPPQPLTGSNEAPAHPAQQFPPPELEKKANAGDVRAMVQIGSAFAAGRGGSRDYTNARRWYEKAAAKGDGDAMARLGDLYFNGLGVPRDYFMARGWFEKAASKDHGEAMDRVGGMFEKGLGVPQDYAIAKQWYEKSAKQNFPAAYLHLAQLYRDGNGVSQDCTTARAWYEEAAGLNNSTAMLMLGELYAEGCHGFRHDKDLARQWYTKAAQAGNEQAKAKLQAMK